MCWLKIHVRIGIPCLGDCTALVPARDHVAESGPLEKTMTICVLPYGVAQCQHSAL